jgi:protein-L-isoaspartate O-methyltransferase
MHDENTYWYRQHFVNALIEQGVLHSPMLKQAFFVVPRDAFIDYYFEQHGTSLVWTRIKAPGKNASKEQKDLWYRTIYSDRALVTQLDEQGRPISSSSMPSVMAMMIEALFVERGHRLLEIGTGTGYNAALLALVAGENHLVTTIEIDPALASNAKRRLDHMMGPRIHVITGDGLHLSSDTRYDRILATGSWACVPPSWTDALAPGGLLVMDLRGDFTGGLVLFQKDSDGTVTDHFLPQGDAAFMPLRPHNGSLTRPAIELNGSIVEETTISSALFSPESLCHMDAALWLQCHFPHLRLRRQYAIDTHALTLYLIDPEQQTTVVIRQQDSDTWHITVYGTYPLWSQAYDSYKQWKQANRPKREHYRLHLMPQGLCTLSYTG